MKRDLAILLFILALLIAGLLIGSPIEVLNPIPHRIITIVAGVLILTLFVYLYRVGMKLKGKATRRIAIVVISIVALPYFLIGLYTSLFVLSSYYPLWEDVVVYTNVEGETVISQFRRTSGSIYDYRNRMVIKDFCNGYRISLDWPESKMHGKWVKHNVAKGTEETVNFKKEK
jgi:hypothetical protein